MQRPAMQSLCGEPQNSDFAASRITYSYLYSCPHACLYHAHVDTHVCTHGHTQAIRREGEQDPEAVRGATFTLPACFNSAECDSPLLQLVDVNTLVDLEGETINWHPQATRLLPLAGVHLFFFECESLGHAS